MHRLAIEEENKDNNNRHGYEAANNERKAVTVSLLFSYYPFF
jgi:hypothetical protein